MSDPSEAQSAAEASFTRTAIGVNADDLEALGERAVRLAFNSGEYGHPGISKFDFVSAWLKDKDFEREESRLSMARISLSISRSTRIWSIIAIVATAIIAAITMQWANIWKLI